MECAGDGGIAVLSWALTAVDDIIAAPLTSVRAGAVWSCRGAWVRLTGSASAVTDPALSARAGLVVRRLIPGLDPPRAANDGLAATGLTVTGLTVTDGRQTWSLCLLLPAGRPPLLVVHGDPPPPSRDLWIVSVALPPSRAARTPVAGLVAGTLVQTACGPQAAETLQPGQRLWTHDGGLVAVAGVETQVLTGARLMALPHLAPICLYPGTLGPGRPDRPLMLAPDQLLAVRNHQAQALFNCESVLVRACDLLGRSAVAPVRGRSGTVYCNVRLSYPALILAEGAACAAADPAPDLRILSGPEAALLHHPARAA